MDLGGAHKALTLPAELLATGGLWGRDSHGLQV